MTGKRGPKQRGVASLSRKAAILYMQGGLTIGEAAERFGISKSSVHGGIDRLREEQRNAWPEDEVTL